MEKEIKQKSVADIISNQYINSKIEIDLQREELTSLEGSPEKVEEFIVSYNNLKNLIGGPKIVKSYYANNNQLESLKGAPEEVEEFIISYNQLKNLTDGPKIVKDYVAFSNQLESLTGSPKEVEVFNVSRNNLKNLIGGPKIVKYYVAYSNELETLEGSPEEVECFYISDNPTLKNTNGIPKRIGILDLYDTTHSASQFTEYPEYVGGIIFDNKIPIEDVKEIVSNIKEVQYVYIGDEKYTKDEILKINKH